MTKLAFTACVLALIACAGAARWQSDFAVGDFQNGAKGMLHIARLAHHDKESEHVGSRVMVRFIVPPSQAGKFEDAWLRLEKDVRDEEKNMQVFDLKKTTLDNTMYFMYGEWETHMDVHDHFMSKHFEDFADYVDAHGIKWQVDMLKGVAMDLEKEGKGKKTELQAKKTKAHHVLIHYHVPPGEGEGFLDAWMDQAEKTVDEKGLRYYGMHKATGDNTNFYVYGTWESFDDFMDHMESGHVGKLMDYIADKDVEYRIRPLMKI